MINFDKAPGMGFQEARKVISNNWPTAGTYTALQEALTEVLRLADIGYAVEEGALEKSFKEPTAEAYTTEEALVYLKATLHNSKADRLMRMFIDAHATFVAKNGDYGDAFAYTLRKHGDKAPLIRITDKFLRIETLLTGREAAVKDETVNDTILDLGNYCFMWLMEKEVQRANASADDKSETY